MSMTSQFPAALLLAALTTAGCSGHSPVAQAPPAPISSQAGCYVIEQSDSGAKWRALPDTIALLAQPESRVQDSPGGAWQVRRDALSTSRSSAIWYWRLAGDSLAIIEDASTHGIDINAQRTAAGFTGIATTIWGSRMTRVVVGRRATCFGF